MVHVCSKRVGELVEQAADDDLLLRREVAARTVGDRFEQPVDLVEPALVDA